MRAAVTTALGPPDVLEIQDLPDPTPGPADLLIEVHASALNPVDTKLRRFGRAGLATPPFVGGYDVSGVVRAVGPAVTGFAVGDEVYASPAIHRPGAHATLVCVNHVTSAPKPRTLTHEQAAALPLVTLTAWESLHRRARIEAGQTVLITAGGGGVGHVAIQLAKLAGCTVLTTASSPDAVALCRQLGADDIIDYRATDFAQVVLDRTANRGADVVLDCVGGDTFEKCPAATAVGGHIVPIVPGPVPQSLATLYPKNVSVHFEFMGAATVSNHHPQRQGEMLRQAAALVDQGKLRPHVFRTYRLDEIRAAHAQQETARTVGKLVVVP
jgi:NADPH2:quinone reductase